MRSPRPPASSPRTAGAPTAPVDLPEGSTDGDLYEDVPSGYISMRPDGLIVRANHAFLQSVGQSAAQVVARRRLHDLLTPSSQIAYTTQWAPLLEVQGEVREIHLDLTHPDGRDRSALLNAVIDRDVTGDPIAIRASVFEVADRHDSERELRISRDMERTARARIERLQRISTGLSAAASPSEVADAILAELLDYLHSDEGSVLLAPSATAGELLVSRGGALASLHGDAGLILPLIVAERSLGAIRIVVPPQHAVSTDEQQLVETACAECAQALHRVQQFAELRERSVQQAAVARLGTRALEGIAIPLLLDEAADVVRETLQSDLAAVVERDSSPSSRLAAHSAISVLDVADALSMPIGGEESGFGTLTVGGRASRSFTASDADFVESVANVLWNAIERRRAEELTKQQAMHDPVTGLANRLLLNERIAQETARSRRERSSFALGLLDLDHFKLVNESVGHAGGDLLLGAVGERLAAAVREIDTVGRIGGDEFVVICAAGDGERAAQALPRRIAEALTTPFRIGATEHVVRASIGMVIGTGDSTPEDLLRDADIAMYSAKSRGRGQHAHFNRAMRSRAQERVRVEAELRVALRRDELRVFYQPIVAAEHGQLVGMEALIRWEHPERGLVMPIEFVPVAEESGLIVDLGRFVLNEACDQLVAWHATGLVAGDVGVAVNVSARQLAQPGFAADVARTLQRCGLGETPALLGLEITETVLMESSRSPAVLAELGTLGVRLLLDDFGTGASSLARLKRFPVDTLKIDRGFVTGLGEPGSEDDAIVSAVIGMADALGLAVIAEGVETERQRERLQELGCPQLQGYLFARPFPADQMAAFLTGSVSAASRREDRDR